MATNANANGIPFLKSKRSGIPDPIKDSMVVWYDIKRQGATNETMKANPILKDLSGNGYDATCYNFAWSGMSGIGSYATNFYLRISEVDVTVLGTQKWRVNTIIHGQPILVTTKSFTGWNKTVTIKIEGLTDNQNNELCVRITDGKILTYLHNGENVVNFGDASVSKGWLAFEFKNKSLTNITIEILPEYPNALVADGVDNYALVEGLPILTDYTVIAKRKRLDIDLGHRGALASKLPLGNSNNGAFAFEFSAADNAKQAVSFGTFSNINFEETDISYQTKNYYNRINIQSGNQLDTDHLSLFSIRERDGCAQAALYSFILFDRTLTDEEIKKWIRENMDENYLLPNERPKPIIYYDFRNGDNSNLTTITDLSGNERHGTMYNFTGEADSGYSMVALSLME